MKKLFIVSIIICVSMTAGTALAQSKRLAAEMIQNYLLEAKAPQETRPTLDPKIFSRTPFVAGVYEAARKIPGVMDKIFCYCYCAINPKFKHKSLLTCYTDEHASQCGICMRQSMVAMDMTREGKSPAEIAGFFKAEYLK